MSTKKNVYYENLRKFTKVTFGDFRKYIERVNCIKDILKGFTRMQHQCTF